MFSGKSVNQTVFEILIHPGFGSATVSTGVWGGSWPDVGSLADKSVCTFNSPEGPNYGTTPTQAIDHLTAKAQIMVGTSASGYANYFPQMVAYKFRALKLS